jgi:hypothetical protein
LGPDRTPEQAAAITKQARETGPVKALEIPLLQAQQSGDPAKIQAANDAYNRALRAAEQDIINQAEAARANKRPDANAPAKSVANVGRTPVPEAINELKANPSAKNRKDFDEVYGPGAAAKALGQ